MHFFGFTCELWTLPLRSFIHSLFRAHSSWNNTSFVYKQTTHSVIMGLSRFHMSLCKFHSHFYSTSPPKRDALILTRVVWRVLISALLRPASNGKVWSGDASLFDVCLCVPANEWHRNDGLDSSEWGVRASVKGRRAGQKVRPITKSGKLHQWMDLFKN